MKKYSDLGHVHRTAPCQEYPGEWLVFSGEQEKSFRSFSDAFAWAQSEVVCESATKVYICWKCSDNDPRQGQVWFTGFYQHGKFNLFGDYKS